MTNAQVYNLDYFTNINASSTRSIKCTLDCILPRTNKKALSHTSVSGGAIISEQGTTFVNPIWLYSEKAREEIMSLRTKLVITTIFIYTCIFSLLILSIIKSIIPIISGILGIVLSGAFLISTLIDILSRRGKFC
jgi:hypothetical protein